MANEFVIKNGFFSQGNSNVTGNLIVTQTLSASTVQFTTLTASVISASSYIGVTATADTGSLLVTASATNATITFTKGDSSTFPIIVNNVVNADTASVSLDTQLFDGRDSITFAGTGSNTFNGNQIITGTLNVSSTVSGTTAQFTSITGSFFGSGASLTNIPNAALVNSSVTVGTTSISLGNSATTIQGLTALTGSTITGSTALFTFITGSTITGSTGLFANLTSSNAIFNTITGSVFNTITTNNLIKYNPSTKTFVSATLISENNSAGTVTISGSVGLIVTGSVIATGLVIDGTTTLGAGFAAGYSTNTTTFTVQTSSYFIGIDTTSGSVSANFLSASSYSAGQMFVFKDIGGFAGTIGKSIVITPFGSEKIDNANGATIAANSGSLTIITDGVSNFYIIGTV